MQPDSPPIVIAAGSDLMRQIALGENSINLNGVNDSRKLLAKAGVDFDVFFITPSYFKQAIRVDPPKNKLIFNTISDSDINIKVLKVLENVLRDNTLKVINAPAIVRKTTRDQIAKQLEGIKGLIAPKTLRLSNRNHKQADIILANSGFNFPGILRPIGTHGGEGALIVQDASSMRELLSVQKESYLTEFIDYRSSDGYFRKYRCFFIGDEIVFRHLITAENWSIHAGDREKLMMRTAWMQKEEESIHNAGIGHFSAGQIKTMRDIKNRIRLDYFGLDFAVMASGELLLFEANATMNFFPFASRDRHHYSWQCLPRAVAAVRRLVEGRLASAR